MIALPRIRRCHPSYISSKLGVQSGCKVIEYILVVDKDLLTNTLIRPVDDPVSKRVEVIQLLLRYPIGMNSTKVRKTQF